MEPLQDPEHHHDDVFERNTAHTPVATSVAEILERMGERQAAPLAYRARHPPPAWR